MAAERTSPDSMPDRLGAFEMIRPVGRGALGEVWEANDPAASRRLLVQVLPEHLAGRPRACDLLREAAYGARLNDRHVLSAEFVGQTGRNVYIATAFVSGETLAERLARPGPLQRDEALLICSQCLQALSAAHAAGIVHGNLQPASIRLDGETARVTDFRLATALAGVTQQPGLPPGSYDVDYLSPEQARGDSFGPEADLYALGVMLFRMLAGRLPFQAETRASMAFQHMYEPPPGISRFVPGIPGPLSAMVERLLAKDPGERYQTTIQAQADLAAWLRGAPLPSMHHADEATTVATETVTDAQDAPVESLSHVRNQLSSTQAAYSQLQRERDELSARLQRQWTAPKRRSETVATRAAQWALVGGLMLLGIYLIWNAWSESMLIPKFKELPEPTLEMLAKASKAGIRSSPGKTLNSRPLVQATPLASSENEDRLPQRIVNSLGMPLIYLRSASYYMGNHEPLDQMQVDLGVQATDIDDEYPLHQAQISQGFYLCQHEVTQSEFERIMGYNPSAFASKGLYAQRVAGMDTRRLPVESVSWNEAIEFCRRLSETPGEKKAGRVYRLPTEVEWEYACRGPVEGDATRYPFGNSLVNLWEHAWLPTRRDEPPFPVAELKPNRFDLYDMAGNVGEWCQDVYNPRAYSTQNAMAPLSLDEAPKAPHVVRRGPRCSARTFGGLDPSPTIGFRVACVWKDAKPQESADVKPSSLMPVTVVNEVGMKFVRLPAGRFRRALSERCRSLGNDGVGTETDSAQEIGRCRVRETAVSRPFFLGMHEVTRGEFRKVLASVAPSGKSAAGADDSHLPQDEVSWYDAVEFCQRLSALPAERLAGRSYRLPTELEWDYAARLVPGGAQVIDDEWTSKNSGGHSHAAGQRAANRQGVHDILGNVAEWVVDTPPVASSGDQVSRHWSRIIRGGSYREPPMAAADRRTAPATAAAAGFRVVLEYGAPTLPWSGPAKIVNLQPATQHSAEIHAALFSVNQRLALSAGDDSVVRVWDFETGRELEPFAGLQSVIRAIAVSSSGRYLATGSDDGEVNLWSFPKRKVIHTFRGHQGRIYALEFGPDGDKELFSAGEDRSIRIWDVEKKTQRDLLQGRDPQLLSLEFPAETTQVFAGGSQGAIMAWNYHSGSELPLLQAGRLPVLSLQSLDSHRVLTSGLLSQSVWDVASTLNAVTAAPVRGPFRILRASPDRSLLAGGNEQGTLDIHALSKVSSNEADDVNDTVQPGTRIGPPLATMPGAHAGPIRSVRFSADGRRLLTAGGDGNVRLWSLQFLKSATSSNHPPIRLLVTSGSGNRTLTYDSEGHLRAWDSTNLQQTKDLQEAGPGGTALAMSADGRLAAFASSGQPIRVWDIEKNQVLHRFTGQPGVILHLAFASDGGRVVSASDDGSLRLWNLERSGESVICSGHTGAAYFACFVSGNRRVVSASEDGTVRFWNPSDGREVQKRTLDSSSTTLKRPPFAISPTGQTAYVARRTAHGSSAVSVWDIESSRELGRLVVRSPQIVAVELSSDGRFLIATETGETTATVWDLQNPSQTVCEIALPQTTRSALAITSTAGYALLAGEDGVLRSWDLPVYRILQNREN